MKNIKFTKPVWAMCEVSALGSGYCVAAIRDNKEVLCLVGTEKPYQPIGGRKQQRELFYNFITWYNAKPKIEKSNDGLITTTIIEEYLKL